MISIIIIITITIRLARLEQFDEADSLTEALDCLSLEIAEQNARSKILESLTDIGYKTNSEIVRASDLNQVLHDRL